MKKIIYIFIIFLTLVQTACIDVVEEIWANKDQSGKYELTLKMDKLIGNPLFKSMIQKAQTNGDSTSTNDDFGLKPMKTKKKGDDFGNLLDAKKDIDSTFSFQSMPDSILRRFDKPEVIRKGYSHVVVNQARKELHLTFGINYNQWSEAEYFFDNLQKIMNEGKDKIGDENANGGLPTDMLGGLMQDKKSVMRSGIGNKALIEFSKGELHRHSRIDPKSSELSGMKKEDMDMMIMFLGNSKHTTIYHLPNKIKKVSHKSATINGNQVTIEEPLGSLLNGSKSLETVIKYKK